MLKLIRKHDVLHWKVQADNTLTLLAIPSRLLYETGI